MGGLWWYNRPEHCSGEAAVGPGEPVWGTGRAGHQPDTMSCFLALHRSKAPELQVRTATRTLAAVAGSPHAHRLLLNAHSARLKRQQQQLLKPQNTGKGQTLSTLLNAWLYSC